MSGVVSFFRKILGFSQAVVKPSANLPLYRNRTIFAEGDRVLVNGKLSIPLQRNSIVKAIAHNDIIGQPVSTFFLRSKENTIQKIEYPSLEQYIALTPRVVTPIYGSYSSFIVSLLDLHVHPSTENDSYTSAVPSIEILEAGTGHGSLTLHLARAIAAANPPPPAMNLPERRRSSSDPSSDPKPTQRQAELQFEWNQWRKSRRAIVYSIDVAAKHSIHAEKLIRGFRQGLYWPHIDFSVGNVEDWVSEQLQTRQNGAGSAASHDHGAFLSHIILDMPGVHDRLEHVCKALRTDGKLLVFVPSITQITECVRKIHEKSLPLKLEDTIELGEGITNGRKWDVRLVALRQTDYSKQSVKAEEDDTESDTAVEDDTEIDQVAEQDQESESVTEVTASISEKEPVLVCRPRVGERIMGGGFIGIWTKTSMEPSDMELEWLGSRKKRQKKTIRKRRL